MTALRAREPAQRSASAGHPFWGPMTYSQVCFVCGERITEAQHDVAVIDFSRAEEGKPLPRTHAECWRKRDALVGVATQRTL